ncbi:AMP-binding protein [Bacillus sp. B6(2022)]|nr:AMP-binding protein [Bacillus sp. B6(2022)]
MDTLAEALKTHQITTGFLTVPLFNRLTEEHPEALSGLHALLVGGDALSAAHIRKALPYLPEGLLNGYGPTENTTFSCVHHIRALEEDQATVPIGQPIAYSQAYVLDDQMQPVPQGVIGEIYVGGTGLALGYLGDEEKQHHHLSRILSKKERVYIKQAIWAVGCQMASLTVLEESIIK